MTSTLDDWYRGRRVLVTGHTGFKGAWLVAWLRRAGAEVTGYALANDDGRPSLFDAAQLDDGIHSIIGDVRDRDRLARTIAEADPEVAFHLAAQSLVRRSYRTPVETFETNVMGTVHFLDSLRGASSLGAVVIVTSDKCYENGGVDHAYREGEPLGGHDPYSASKACAELVTAAMRRSFFSDGAAVGSARAGNVIGGGDWSEDRLVPDVMAAAAAGRTTPVRNPSAVRPWQHVLEALRGYLQLGRGLARDPDLAGAWNFGPAEQDAVSVSEVTSLLADAWDRVSIQVEADVASLHEAALLRLDVTKAGQRLGWAPVLTLPEAIRMTVDWYRGYYDDPSAAPALVEDQLAVYGARCTAEGSL